MANSSSDAGTGSWLTSRAAVVAAIVAASLGTAVVVCGANVIWMLSVACLDGVAAAMWVGGAVALGDALARTCGVRAAGPLRVATAGGIGLGVFSLLGLGLGLVGALNRPVVLAFPAAGYVWFGADLARRGATRTWGRDAIVEWLRRPAGTGWVWVIPAVSLTMSVVAASIWPGVLWRDSGDPHPYDVTSYHLQVPREWYEAGKIVPLRHNMFSYFPMNAEVQSLLLMHAAGGPKAPWTAMYACQFVSVGYALLMVLGVAGALSAEAGRPGHAGAIAGAVASAVPWVVMLAGVAYVESALMLYTALTVAWALKATEPSGSAAGSSAGSSFVKSLLIAGVFAGLACGVKITAVPMLLAAVPVAVACTRAVPWRTWIIGCGAFVLAGSVVASPWLIRNVAWAGNPLWPVGMSALGRDHFSPEQQERFRVAHSPTDAQRPVSARLGVLWRDVLDHWQFGYALLPAALAAAVWRWRDRQTRLLVALAMVVLLVWFGFTHLLPRFLVMGIPIAAILIGRASTGRAWPVGLAVALLAATLGWIGVVPALTAWSRLEVAGGLFGITDFRDLIAEAQPLAEAVDLGKQIGIVGDAQAFFFQVPMSRLHYRTVFDLPGNEPDPVAAWVGKEAEGNPNWLLVVNPAEVARLHKTYRFTPAPPGEWATKGSGTFLLRGDEVRGMTNDQDPKPNQNSVTKPQ